MPVKSEELSLVKGPNRVLIHLTQPPLFLPEKKALLEAGQQMPYAFSE